MFDSIPIFQLQLCFVLTRKLSDHDRNIKRSINISGKSPKRENNTVISNHYDQEVTKRGGGGGLSYRPIGRSDRPKMHSLRHI